MKIVLSFMLFTSSFCMAQQEFQQALQKYNEESIPYIKVKELHQELEKPNLISILDARKVEEYQVSHLPNAIFAGDKEFDIQQVQKRMSSKTLSIIVYCTIGVRSEKIAKKLKEAGYHQVKNLYGGILEWKNKGYKLYNLQSKPTDSVHTYNKKWSRYLHQGKPVF
ncbi:rhodanese-like domain-containing protein [Mesonia sp. MT50]|uniref:Rhodanese-like domain-containing protein n=1 Tax=Mesonia profundi TaxID=3070998 RepID=A0ABU0ZZX3_9FLAO|nr:rhodanese-like domain-containing protein [Mesonia profundi]MDQ7916288.1 rhodanese-like domain-containing protein [Mesonia profundi]